MSSAPFNTAAFTCFPVCVMQHVKLIIISVQYWFSDLYIHIYNMYDSATATFFFSSSFSSAEIRQEKKADSGKGVDRETCL